MKVKDLLAELEKFPSDAEVKFANIYECEGGQCYMGDGVEVSANYDGEIVEIIVDSSGF